MVYFWFILLVVTNACFVFLTFFAIPGNWLIVGATCLFAWMFRDQHFFSVYVLVTIVALAAIAEIVELFSGAGGAKRAGASFYGSAGALAGMLLGALTGTFLIPIPFLGTVIGSCSGAALGCVIMELIIGKDPKKTFRFGLGAGVGVFVGTMTKFIIGCIICLIILIAGIF